ncbi:MAG: hypothetical protein ACREFE_14790 [Limisphaerales bacterium]
MKTKLKCLIAGLIFAVANLALADNPTALNLIKLGDQYVGVQCKDKVVQIRSDRSVGSLTPDIWYVVYYDPDATFKATEVKFGAGQKMDVSRPWRALEMATDEHQVLDRSKIKMDSDRAIQIATSQDLLKNLTLKATQVWLEHGDEGPQWRVKIWAAKLDNPNKEAYVGEVVLSADDGKIIKTDLHPGSVD